MYIMKSRGMKHSNQVREFVINDDGLSLVDVFLGAEGVLVGSAREAQELEEATGMALRSHASSRTDREIQRKKLVLEAKIASMQEEFESVKDELNKTHIEEQLRKEILERNRAELKRKRLDQSSGKSSGIKRKNLNKKK
jgi:circadian clock protein KaiC